MFPVCARLSCSHYPSVLQFVPIYPTVFTRLSSSLCQSVLKFLLVYTAVFVRLTHRLCPFALHSLSFYPALCTRLSCSHCLPNVFACLSPTLCPCILHSLSCCSRLCQSHDPVSVCLTIGLSSICPEVFVKTPSVQHVQSVFVCPALSARLSCSL